MANNVSTEAELKHQRIDKTTNYNETLKFIEKNSRGKCCRNGTEQNSKINIFLPTISYLILLENRTNEGNKLKITICGTLTSFIAHLKEYKIPPFNI